MTLAESEYGYSLCVFAKIAKGTKSAKSIEQKLKLIHFAPRKVEPKHFQLVAGALLEGKRLNLQYWNRGQKDKPHASFHLKNWFTIAKIGG